MMGDPSNCTIQSQERHNGHHQMKPTNKLEKRDDHRAKVVNTIIFYNLHYVKWMS